MSKQDKLTQEQLNSKMDDLIEKVASGWLCKEMKPSSIAVSEAFLTYQLAELDANEPMATPEAKAKFKAAEAAYKEADKQYFEEFKAYNKSKKMVESARAELKAQLKGQLGLKGFQSLLSTRLDELLTPLKFWPDQKDNLKMKLSVYCNNLDELANSSVSASNPELALKEVLLDKKITRVHQLSDKAITDLTDEKKSNPGSELDGKIAIYSALKTEASPLNYSSDDQTLQQRVDIKEKQIRLIENILAVNYEDLSKHRKTGTPFFKGLLEFGFKVPYRAIRNVLAATYNKVLANDSVSVKRPLVTPFWRAASAQVAIDIKDVIHNRKPLEEGKTPGMK